MSADGTRWISCRLRFFVHVDVLSALFRRLMCERLAAHAAGKLILFGDHFGLVNADAFAAFMKRLRKIDWVAYCKLPFAGPDSVLAYLARYTHRVAIGNSQLVAFDGKRVSFKWKDYRAGGAARRKIMTLDAGEFMRRFLLHVLPDGFHRIRLYGILANPCRVENVAKARAQLGAAPPPPQTADRDEAPAPDPCPCCGGRMILIETFERGSNWRSPAQKVNAS